MYYYILIFFILSVILCMAILIKSRPIRCLSITCTCVGCTLLSMMISGMISKSEAEKEYYEKTMEFGILFDTLYKSSKTNDIQVLQEQLVTVMEDVDSSFSSRASIMPLVRKLDTNYNNKVYHPDELEYDYKSLDF